MAKDKEQRRQDRAERKEFKKQAAGARKQYRIEQKVRRDDERMGILQAMDANRASMSNVNPEEPTATGKRKAGMIKISTEPGKPPKFESAQPEEVGSEPMYRQMQMYPEVTEKRKRIEIPGEGGIPQKVIQENEYLGLNRKDFTKFNKENPALNPTAVNTPVSGSAIVDGVIAGNGDINEVNAAAKDAKTANQKELELKGEISEGVNQAIIETGAIPEEPLPGDGSTLGSQQSIQVQAGGRPSFDQITTKGDIYAKILERNRDMMDQVPSVVLEDLSVEDYYPNIRKDIAVGSYQGKYLGSATIFAAPAARAPLGLYDARKRALKTAAQEKQKKIDDLLSSFDTAPQYQAKFNESFYTMLESELERVGYDFDALSTDPEAVRKIARYEAKAKEITEAVTYADAMFTAYKDANTYVPDEVMNVASDIKYAQINNLEDILSGESNMVALLNKAKAYKNLMPEVQKLAEDLLDPARMKQRPINLKTGGIYDSPEWIKERDEFFAKVKDGVGYDVYATGILKYFDGDFKGIIENLVKGSGGSEDQIEPMQKMFARMIQEQYILDYENISNDEARMADIAERRRQFDINQKNMQNNFWGNINGALGNKPPTDANGNPIDKSYNEALREAALIRDPKKRAEKIKEIAAKYQVGALTYDAKNDTYVYSHGPSPKLAQDPARAVSLKDGRGNATRRIRGEYYDTNKKQWVVKDFTPEEITVGWASTKRLKLGGIEYKPGKDEKGRPNADLEAIGKWAETSKNGSVWVKTVGAETKKAFVNSRGETEYLRADGSNIEEYLASNNQIVYTIPIEKPFYRREVTNADTGKTEYIDTELPGIMTGPAINISNQANQQAINNQWGYTPLQAASSGC